MHRSGAVLTAGMSSVEFDTSVFDARGSVSRASSRSRFAGARSSLLTPLPSLQPGLDRHGGRRSRRDNGALKSDLELCRQSPTNRLESDIVNVAIQGDAPRVNDTVYFAPGQYMDLTLTERSSSRASAAPSDPCYQPKECRWWNSTARDWQQTGCTYIAANSTCRCSAAVGDIAIVTPIVECTPVDPGTTAESASGASDSGASTIIAAVVSVVAVIAIGAGFLPYRQRQEKVRQGLTLSPMAMKERDAELGMASAEEKISRTMTSAKMQRDALASQLTLSKQQAKERPRPRWRRSGSRSAESKVTPSLRPARAKNRRRRQRWAHRRRIDYRI